MQVHATLPTLPVPSTQLVFPSKSPSILLVLSPNALTAYHIEKRRLLPVSPNSQLAEINMALRDRYLPSQGAGMDGNKLVIWGHEFLLTTRLDTGSLSHGHGSSTGTGAGVGGAGTGTGTGGGGGGGGGARKDRRKRAREAREALERSTSLSISTPLDPTGSPAPSTPHSVSVHSGSSSGGEDYSVKVHGTESFRSIIGVGWMSPLQDRGQSQDRVHVHRDITGMVHAGTSGHGEGEGEMVVVERPVGDFLADLPPAFVVASFGRS